MPVELRNEIARLEIAGEHSAGGGVPARRALAPPPRSASSAAKPSDVAQPLLAPRYYLTKALAPFADVREASRVRDRSGAIASGRPCRDPDPRRCRRGAGRPHDALAAFVEDGGILVRFAGTRLAGAADDLVPVRLRRGGRVLGGAMSWDTPKKLAPFERQSPFFGLPVPDDVTITRQVLAEPDPGLLGKTWAQLSDGTPLVTATRQGKG